MLNTKERSSMENKTARFDLTLLMEEHEQGHRGFLEYNSHLFDEASIEQMVGHFQALLESIVDTPEQGIQDIPLSSATPPQAVQVEASAMPRSLIEPQHNLRQARIIYGYAKNEMGTWTPVYEVQLSRASHHRAPVRKPVDNLHIHLLDHSMHPAPHGTIGEVYIGGTEITNAYLNHSTEHIAPHIRAINGEYLYKTGDFARRLSNGNLVLVGRSHEHAEIRGVRVWLTEIEDVLTTLPGVLDAIAQAQASTNGETHLVAYIVATPEMKSQLTTKSLRSSMKELIPNYLIPTTFMLLDQLPLTSDGEVDRAVLPVVDDNAIPFSATDSPPRSQLEQDIARIWCQILKIENVGIHDNFFDRGGHSLLLIKLHSELQTQLHLDIAILDLFKYPTISSLAQYSQQEQAGPSSQEIQQIQQRSDKYKSSLQAKKAFIEERRKSHGIH
jgi:acyl carrier protein